jgi:outer membrane receptor protein involved in Fe transport
LHLVDRPHVRRLSAPAAAVLLLCTSLAVQAQTAPVDLQRVEVIGVTPIKGLGVPKDRIPSNVQTATDADLEKSHAIDLTNLLNRKLGSIHINEVQNNPFQPDVNFRGFTASPLLGTPQGLSVYADGVRLNQPFGDVVSWDLIPKSAISSISLIPGSNPTFGLNTLGGALSIQTKDGLTHPGTSIQVLAGSNKRAAIEFETGGSRADGFNWFVTGNRFREDGWREDSPSDVGQLFGKFGLKTTDGSISLTAAVADTDLNGNGLQEKRLLDRDYSSVYTKPDTTENRSIFLNLVATQKIRDGLSFSGNAYYRRIKTDTFNGDINDDVLEGDPYQPDSDEQNALTAAGYTGFPTSGENGSNTPFPKWKCIAQALLVDEPAEVCNGVINKTKTEQSNYGLSGQLDVVAPLAGMNNQFVIGAALDFSRVEFKQGSELGYLNPDRSVTGVGAFGDGVTGGDADGEPYDTRVDLSARTRTWSVFASDTLALNPQTYLTASARYNRTSVKSRDAIIPGGGPGSLDGDHVFSRLNPAIGLTFAASESLTAYAGINQGSRAPSAIELGCADPANPCKLPNSFAGDPPLKQVVATTFETGVRGRSGSLIWNLGVFRTDSRDDILFVADNASGFGYFRNFGKTRRQGLEAGLATSFAGVAFGANYTYLDVTYRSSELVNGAANSSNEEAESGFPGVEGNIAIKSGDRIPLIPRHVLKVFADVPVSAQWSFGADVTAVSSSLARGNENGKHKADGLYYLGPGKSSGYAVLNLNGEYRPTTSLKFFAQVTNVFDREYSTAAQLGATGFDANGNFVTQPFPEDANGDRPLVNSTFYAPGAPRTFWVGLRYDFDN